MWLLLCVLVAFLLAVAVGSGSLFLAVFLIGVPLSLLGGFIYFLWDIRRKD